MLSVSLAEDQKTGIVFEVDREVSNNLLFGFGYNLVDFSDDLTALQRDYKVKGAFIRLILGPDISNRQIAQRWKMDENNFSEFKIGKYPVPRLERLESLAKILGVNKHLVFEVALGASVDKVFNLIKKNDLPGQIKLLFGNGTVTQSVSKN